MLPNPNRFKFPLRKLFPQFGQAQANSPTLPHHADIPPQIKNTGTFIPVFSRYSIPLTHFTLNGFNELTSRKSAVHKSISIHSAKAR